MPGSDLMAACDAIIPSMVERDPEWAGWCSALVNLNDLAAMGAAPVGLLDARRRAPPGPCSSADPAWARPRERRMGGPGAGRAHPARACPRRCR